MQKNIRGIILSVACCLVLTLAFALPGQSQRPMYGTGVGSDIAVPYYTPRVPTYSTQQSTTTTTVETNESTAQATGQVNGNENMPAAEQSQNENQYQNPSEDQN